MLYRKELLERLDRLDEEASLMFDSSQRFHMVLVGGSALVLLEHIVRATHDIDVLEAPRELADLLGAYDIDTQVSAYICNFPYNYQERLIDLDVGKRRIDYSCVSLEDIVIAKLHGMRAQDIQDITSRKVLDAVDWDLLEEVREEMKLSALSTESMSYRDFIFAYDDYLEKYRR
jgi:hypothetical protein